MQKEPGGPVGAWGCGHACQKVIPYSSALVSWSPSRPTPPEYHALLVRNSLINEGSAPVPGSHEPSCTACGHFWSPWLHLSRKCILCFVCRTSTYNPLRTATIGKNSPIPTLLESEMASDFWCPSFSSYSLYPSTSRPSSCSSTLYSLLAIPIPCYSFVLGSLSLLKHGHLLQFGRSKCKK